MYHTVVYDDGKVSQPIEVFEGAELEVVRKATNAARFLRKSGKGALGRYTFRLERIGD